MLTLLALLAALLGPGPILADNSGGGPVDKAVVGGTAAAGPARTATRTSVGGLTVTVTVDDNSGGGPVDRK